MPTYEFVCEKCKEEFDIKLTIENLTAIKVLCPKCGNSNLKRVWNIPFIHYRGKGFYNTDKDNK